MHIKESFFVMADLVIVSVLGAICNTVTFVEVDKIVRWSTGIRDYYETGYSDGRVHAVYLLKYIHDFAVFDFVWIHFQFTFILIF